MGAAPRSRCCFSITAFSYPAPPQKQPRLSDAGFVPCRTRRFLSAELSERPPSENADRKRLAVQRDANGARWEAAGKGGRLCER